MTCTAIMVSASHCVGFTLPGIIDEPGSFSGINSSPKPHRGPEADQRTSFAILNNDAASVFSDPESCTIASCAESASNLLGAVRNGKPDSSAILAATLSAYPSGVFKPVPTAVPPNANSNICTIEPFTRCKPLSSCATYPENSWPTVTGVASIKWVRPILTTSLKASAFSAKVSLKRATIGTNRRSTSITAAICIAVGNVSLELCDLFTSSFG